MVAVTLPFLSTSHSKFLTTNCVTGDQTALQAPGPQAAWTTPQFAPSYHSGSRGTFLLHFRRILEFEHGKHITKSPKYANLPILILDGLGQSLDYLENLGIQAALQIHVQ